MNVSTLSLDTTQILALNSAGLGFLVDVLNERAIVSQSLLEEFPLANGTDLALTAAGLDATTEALGALTGDVDKWWLLLSGILVFLMQPGFAMLEAGSVRSKNVINIFLKNVLDPCIGAIGFWAIGWGIAYGPDGGSVIGWGQLFLVNTQPENPAEDGSDWVDFDGGYASWFFQFAFAATAATIVSGAVAERCQLGAYLSYSFFLTAFVYPVVVCWGWGGGFMSAWLGEEELMFMGIGVVDFAGCGVVHMVGGCAGLIGAKIMGPRIGRFNPDGTVNEIRGHSIPLQVLGTFLLWAGWYGFNPGSTLAIVGYGEIAAKTATTTTIAAVAGAVTNMVYAKVVTKTYDLTMILNGVLAGLVSITSGCSVVEPVGALFAGIIGSLVFCGSSKMLKKLLIDDVIDASPVHYFTGFWGLMVPGLFATKYNFDNAYGTVDVDGGGTDKYGLFYGGGGTILVVNIVFGLIVTAWVAATMVPFFLVLHKMNKLRVPAEMEAEGADTSKHGGSAYTVETPAAGGIQMPKTGISSSVAD